MGESCRAVGEVEVRSGGEGYGVRGTWEMVSAAMS